MSYPNYRVSVQCVIKLNNKIIIAKRAEHCKVAPGVWAMPAGKVKYDEIPTVGAIRETKEETSLNCKIVQELGCHTTSFKSGDEDAYRLVFSYLLEPTEENPEVVLNDEHSEYALVGLDDIDLEKYNSLTDNQKANLRKALSL